MATLVLNRVPQASGYSDETSAQRVQLLVTALRDHFRGVPVDTTARWAGRIRVPVPVAELDYAAALYCDGAGFEYVVEEGT